MVSHVDGHHYLSGDLVAGWWWLMAIVIGGL